MYETLISESVLPFGHPVSTVPSQCVFFSGRSVTKMPESVCVTCKSHFHCSSFSLSSTEIARIIWSCDCAPPVNKTNLKARKIDRLYQTEPTVLIPSVSERYVLQRLYLSSARPANADRKPTKVGVGLHRTGVYLRHTDSTRHTRTHGVWLWHCGKAQWKGGNYYCHSCRQLYSYFPSMPCQLPPVILILGNWPWPKQTKPKQRPIKWK